MTDSNNIFIETGLVDFDGRLRRLSIGDDWSVTIDTEEKPLALEPEAALCLSAMMSLVDRLLGAQDREEAIAVMESESITRGMPLTKFNSTGLDEVEAAKNIKSTRTLYEQSITHSKLSLYPFMYNVGYTGARRLMFCTNLVSMSYGLKKIEDFFSTTEENTTQQHYEKDFARQYAIRKQTQPQVKQKDDVVDEPRTPPVKIQRSTPIITETRTLSSEIVDPLTKKQGRKTKNSPPLVDTAASLRRVIEVDDLDILEELLSKYSPLHEYRSDLVDYITELSYGSIIKESDLIEQVSSLGHTPNPADIDRVILECNGLIKKTFTGEPGRTETIAFKRFDSR